MIFETSFDDGTTRDIQIAKLLIKYNLPGTFYIVTDWVDTGGFLGWEEIKELDHLGFKIGSHTCSHPSDLKLLYDDQLEYELETSKGIIESVLGHVVTDFCYPRGRQDERIVNAVAAAGYLEARITGVPGKILMEDKLLKPGTIQVYPRKEYKGKSWFNVAMQKFEEAIETPDSYFNLWGHSKEILMLGEYERLGGFLKYVHQRLNKIQ